MPAINSNTTTREKATHESEWLRNIFLRPIPWIIPWWRSAGASNPAVVRSLLS